jgi:hypothetical protein
LREKNFCFVGIGTFLLFRSSVSSPGPVVTDYCYSGRLHYRSYDLVLQPLAFRSCLLWQIPTAVLFFQPFGRTFQDEVSFRLR